MSVFNIVFSWFSEHSQIILTGFFSILSAYIGGKIASSKMVKLEREKRLAEAYILLFSEYIRLGGVMFSGQATEQDRARLLGACEQLRLICSNQTEKIVADLEDALTDNSKSLTDCGNILGKLRQRSRAEIPRKFKLFM